MEITKIAWILSYIQRGVAEVQKNNLLDKLSKGKLEVEVVEELFKKIRNEFGETREEERKVEQLRIIEQRSRTYDEHVQEFKKIAKGSEYERQPFIEEFKKGLNEGIRKKLAEAESPSSLIEEWQERSVRLDRNQRQSRAEERILEKNIVCPLENTQQKGEFERGLYRRRGGQIIQKAGAQNFRREYQNKENQYRRTETKLGSKAVNGGRRRGRY